MNQQLARSPRSISLALAALAMMALPGCAAIADIFKAGVWGGRARHHRTRGRGRRSVLAASQEVTSGQPDTSLMTAPE